MLLTFCCGLRSFIDVDNYNIIDLSKPFFPHFYSSSDNYTYETMNIIHVGIRIIALVLCQKYSIVCVINACFLN